MPNREESFEYWKQMEAELGERIQGYALGQLLTPLEGIPSFAYCLFYLTDTRLFVRYIPPERKILSLPVGSRGEKLQVRTISLQRRWIQKIDLQIPKRWPWSWFFPPLATLRISFTHPGGMESEIQCTMESRKNAFLRSLDPENLP